MSTFDIDQALNDQERLVQQAGINRDTFRFFAARHAMIEGVNWYVREGDYMVSMGRNEYRVYMYAHHCAPVETWTIPEFLEWDQQRFGQEIEKIINGG